MDQPSNVIQFPTRRRVVAICPPNTPPQAARPAKVHIDHDVGLTRSGDRVMVTTPGVHLDEEVVIAPAVPPASARLIAEKLLTSARVAECKTCAPRLAEATDGEVFDLNAVGLCAECSA